MIIRQIISFCCVLLLMISCTKARQKQVDLNHERAQILKLHMDQRDYHFQKDSISFANQLAEDFISVSKGKITKPSRKETITRYHNYLSSVEFNKWDDTSEPIISISDDGTMAYTIVDKIVELTYELDNGEIVGDTTHYAWTAIYKKYDDSWKVESVTSTDRRN